MNQTIKLRDRIRRISIISTLYAIGLVEAYYLPRYGIQWLELIDQLGRLRAARKGLESCDRRLINGCTRLEP